MLGHAQDLTNPTDILAVYTKVLTVTIEAQRRLKEGIMLMEVVPAEEGRILEARLSNADTALDLLSSLWHIAYQDVEGQP